MTRLLLAACLLVFSASPMVAQVAARPLPDSTSVTSSAVVIRPTGFQPRISCEPAASCAAQEQDRSAEEVAATRKRYALVGFVIGAGTGWLLANRSCAEAECTGSVGALLWTAGGGVVGLVVGLLLGPSPRS